MDYLITHLDRIGVGAGALVTIVTAWRFLVRPHIKRAVEAIDLVRSELKTNGGSSMRDELRRIERCLSMLNASQRAQLDSLVNVAVFEADENGDCTFVNRAYTELVGRRRDDLMGNGWVNVLCPKFRQDCFDSWHTAVRQQRPYDEVIEYQHVDGKCFNVRVKAQPIFVNQDLVGYIGSAAPAE